MVGPREVKGPTEGETLQQRHPPDTHSLTDVPFLSSFASRAEDSSAAPAASRVNALLEQLEQPEPAPLDPFLEVAAGGELPRQELNAREANVLQTVINNIEKKRSSPWQGWVGGLGR